MLSGSLVGSAAAFILTRQLTQGRNIENLASGALISISPGSATLGIPTIRLKPQPENGRGRLSALVPILSVTSE